MTQLSLDLRPADDDATGSTEIVEGACPACRSQPAALRHLTTRVAECRYCRAILSLREGIWVLAIADRRIGRGSDLPARRARR